MSEVDIALGLEAEAPEAADAPPSTEKGETKGR